jgi:hypothetical protein
MLNRVAAWFELLRPRTLAQMNKSVTELVGHVGDLRQSVKALAGAQRSAEQRTGEALAGLSKTSEELLAAVRTMTSEIRAVEQTVGALTIRESQLRAIVRADAQLEDELPSLAAVCDEKRVAECARAAIGRAELHDHPFPYAVITDVFPDDFYAALIRGLPPVELFAHRPWNKQQLKTPLTVAPAYSRQIWNYLVDTVIPQILQPLIMEKFRASVAQWIAENWPSLADEPFAPPMEFGSSDGRIMLRGRGYYIRPHRDPKWGFLTGLIYLPRAKDSETWGTQLFTVTDDHDIGKGAAPYWIAPERCRLAVDVPFRRNSMLVVLNSTGAHGAQIPEDAEPADLQRYIFQFRIGPTEKAIPMLQRLLAEDRREMWAGKLLTDY